MKRNTFLFNWHKVFPIGLWNWLSHRLVRAMHCIMFPTANPTTHRFQFQLILLFFLTPIWTNIKPDIIGEGRSFLINTGWFSHFSTKLTKLKVKLNTFLFGMSLRNMHPFDCTDFVGCGRGDVPCCYRFYICEWFEMNFWRGQKF